MAIPFQRVADHIDAHHLHESPAGHVLQKWHHHRHDQDDGGKDGMKPRRIHQAGRHQAGSLGVMQRSFGPSGPEMYVTQSVSQVGGFRQSPLTDSQLTANFGSTTIPAGTSLHSLKASQIHGTAPRVNESSMSFGPAVGQSVGPSGIMSAYGQPVGTSAMVPVAHPIALKAPPLAAAHRQQMEQRGLGFMPTQTPIEMSPGGSYTVQIPSHAAGVPQAQAVWQQQQLVEGPRFTTENAPDARSGHTGEPALLRKQKHSHKSKTKAEEKKKKDGCC